MNLTHLDQSIKDEWIKYQNVLLRIRWNIWLGLRVDGQQQVRIQIDKSINQIINPSSKILFISLPKMKFQFCGHINCPQWFIAQISVLTKITAVKMKLIFTQIIQHYLQSTDITAKVSKLLNGTGLDYYEMHSVVATLQFILENSVAFNVTDLTLNKELIDLGLPKENVESITKTYKSSKDKLVQKSLQNVLKTTDNIQLQYSVHELLASSKTGNIKNLNIKKPTFAQVQLKYSDCIEKQNRDQSFLVTCDQLDYLIYELENGLQTIERLEKSQTKRNQTQQDQ